MGDSFNQFLSDAIDLADAIFVPKTGAEDTGGFVDTSKLAAETPIGTTQQADGTKAGTGFTAFGAGAQLPMILIVGGSILLAVVLIKAIK